MGAVLLALSLAGAAMARERAAPGRFDYYLLSLSWSPAHCATEGERAEPTQCAPGRRFGFVVHGLWPQYERGWPQYCARTGRLAAETIERMLPIMPSRDLIAHQWRKHGTCQGGDAEAYFATIRQAFARVRIPAPLTAPPAPVATTVAELERLFARANPGLDGDMIAVRCTGRRLAEVQICLDKDLDYRPCAPDVRDRCRGTVTVPPTR